MRDSVQQLHRGGSAEVSESGSQLSHAELRHIQLCLLDVFRRACEEHEIRFYAYYGTLIGALRHKGFIPWDDDIDLAVPREDYDRLASIDWNLYGVVFLSPEARRDYPYTNGKIVDKATSLVEEMHHALDDLGVNIDIFPIDSIPQSAWRASLEQKLLSFLVILRNLKVVKFRRSRTASKNLVLWAARLLLVPIPVGTLSRLIIAIAAGNRVAGDRAGSRVGPYGGREIVPRQLFHDVIHVEFEGRQLPAPSGYQEILTSIYGEYMVPPPPEKRVTHHSFRAYWR